ncbi:hypothetical protein [Actinomadura sp. K4S16]|uniref:hypothetical protein n=1 Tax=Actinomadura sp. K4S16 TaxID=1316147 RepID=UPI0011ED600F|nr:hypothetical protein [Actinomadura sp. K4S16]
MTRRKPVQEVPECERCGQRIVWALTRRGRWQPLDPEPDPGGSVLAYRDALGVLRARSLASAGDGPRHPLERVHMPHAATCGGPRQEEPPWDPASEPVASTGRRRLGEGER